MTTGVIKRIDDLGRIAIPRSVRDQLHIGEGDTFEISINDSGDIVLSKQHRLQEVAANIFGIKQAVMEDDRADDICEQVFSYLHKIEDLINTVK